MSGTVGLGMVEHDDLADLLARAGAGDTAAFARLVDQTLPSVYRFALVTKGDRRRAGDLVQLIYRRAWVEASTHATAGLSPTAWLLTRVELPVRSRSPQLEATA